jgi:hypothetical protein
MLDLSTDKQLKLGVPDIGRARTCIASVTVSPLVDRDYATVAPPLGRHM